MPSRRHMTGRLVTLLVGLPVLTASVSAQSARTGAETPALLRPLAAALTGQVSLDPTVIRQRGVRVAPEVLAALAPGQNIRFDLFEDRVFTGVIERAVKPDGWTGRIVGEPGGIFTLITSRGVAAARISVPDVGTWMLRPGQGDVQVVVEIDEAALPPCAGAQVFPHDFQEDGGVAGLDFCADGSEIDVLIFYTNVARQAAGGVAAIEAEINLAVANANIAYPNSVIGTQINLVHMEEIAYDENGTYSQHLNRLNTPGDGFMDEVHALRWVYQADLVDLIVHDGENCGIATILSGLSPTFDEDGFSVTTWYCAADLVLAHEMGHNMGCCHACGDGGGCGCGGLFTWSVGHRFNGNSATLWRTVMAYSPGQRIFNFSNPDVNVDGQPTGVPIGQSGEADNASTINTTKSTIASFRCGFPYCEVEKIEASDGNFFDYFGWGVGVSGDVAIASSLLDSDGPSFAGAVYTFSWDDQSSAWAEDQKLTAPDAASSDFFGQSVAIDGDVIVVGTVGDDDAGGNSGSANVFRHNGASWVFDQKLTAGDASADDRFGESVSVSGDVIVVGAWFDDPSADESGSAYVFRYNSGTTTWEEEDKLVASDGAEDDHFGASVSVDGDVILVGAPSTTSALGPGAAYAFRYNAGTTSWDEEDKLTASNPLPLSEFGGSVSVSGSAGLVGARGTTALGVKTGSAYVFREDGGVWTEEAELIPPDGGANDRFGTRVSLSGDIAVIGADGRDDWGADAGGGYIYRDTGSGYQHLGKVLALDGAAGDAYGVSVAVGDGRAIIGANLATGDGAIYAYAGFTGTDCNGNGLADACEILSGAVTDDNGDGIPDECATPGDVDGDGFVNVTDLLLLLGSWGPCPDPCPPSCAADFDGDCSVGVTDLLTLLGNWTV